MSEAGHQGHGGHSYAGQGGDSAGVSQALGQHGHQQHGIVSHLLGLDHEHGHGGQHGHQGNHNANHGQQIDQTPQGSISWSSPLQALKLSDIFQGINVTPNTMFLLLFVGFGAWLYVVYWVRHHEPLANQVLGAGGGYSSTAHADRQIVAGIRNAMPIRTGNSTGAVYVPDSGAPAPMPSAPSGAFAATPLPQPSYNPAVSAPPHPAFSAPALEPGLLAPLMHPGMTDFSQSPVMGSYSLPVHRADGTRVRTVVQR